MRHLTTTCQDPIQPPKQLSAANVFANFMPQLGALSEDTEIVMIDLIIPANTPNDIKPRRQEGVADG